MTDAQIIQIIEQHDRIFELLTQVKDPVFLNFFDIESDNLLPEKIQVLEQIVSGKRVDEIPNYYDVLELYPKDGVHWD